MRWVADTPEATQSMTEPEYDSVIATSTNLPAHARSLCILGDRVEGREEVSNETKSLGEAQPELLPCPFCGNIRIVKYTTAEGELVGCDNCENDIVRGTMDEAVDNWNTRATPTAAAVEASREDAIKYLTSICAPLDEERILLAQFLATNPTPLQINLATKLALNRAAAAPAAPDIEGARNVLVEVGEELAKARQQHANMNGHHEGYAVILEELGELWEVCKRNTHKFGSEAAVRAEQRKMKRAEMRKEAIQIAAMAIRFIEDVCDR